MSVHPGSIKRVSLLRQPRDRSTFDVFIAGEQMSWQVLLIGGKHEYCWVSNPERMADGPVLPNQKHCTNSESAVPCAVGHHMEEKAQVAKNTVTLAVPTEIM
jgi:hypothetical protein